MSAADAPAARVDEALASESQARAALVAAARRLGPAGLNTGRAGNLSLRWHRGGAEGLLVTPSGVDYDALDEAAIAWLPLAQPDDPGLAGDDDALRAPARWFGPLAPSSEWRMHRDLLAARLDAGAVVHAHAPHATALACTAIGQATGIPPFHYMVAVAGGANVRCAPYRPFGSSALSSVAVAALQGRRACLLANHGLVTIGAGLQAAFELAIEVEALARSYALALAIGTPTLLDAAQIADALARFGAYRRH